MKKPNPAPVLQVEALSAAVKPVVDAALAYDERVAAMRQLSPDLNPTDLNGLYAFLQQRSAADENQWGQAVKNVVMDQLCEWDTPRVREVLTAIYGDAGQDIVIRDYALQHLVEFYQRLADSGAGQASKRDLEQFAQLLWEAAGETGGSIPGTALLGLSRLSETLPQFDRERVAATACQLAANSAAGEFSRITAMQVCARMGVNDAVPVIWQTAQYGETVPLQISAIGALGLMDQTDARPFLNDLLNGDVDYLKPAAREALGQMDKLEKQRAIEQQQKLDEQRARELQEEKARRRGTAS